MSILLFTRAEGAADRQPERDFGAGARMNKHSCTYGVFAGPVVPERCWRRGALAPTDETALTKIVDRSRNKGAAATRRDSLAVKTCEKPGRFAILMRRYACAVESGRFVLRCSVAASLAYGLATFVGFQLVVSWRAALKP
jgi:hypothetical protein